MCAIEKYISMLKYILGSAMAIARAILEKWCALGLRRKWETWSGEHYYAFSFCISWTYFMMLAFITDVNAFTSRLQTAQIPSPEPIMLRSHVLVMSFIGRDDMYVGIYRHTNTSIVSRFSTFPPGPSCSKVIWSDWVKFWLGCSEEKKDWITKSNIGFDLDLTKTF